MSSRREQFALADPFVCSTPFGITDVFTRAQARLRHHSIRAQRLSASQMSSPKDVEARCLGGLRAQRLSASQMSSPRSAKCALFQGSSGTVSRTFAFSLFFPSWKIFLFLFLPECVESTSNHCIQVSPTAAFEYSSGLSIPCNVLRILTSNIHRSLNRRRSRTSQHLELLVLTGPVVLLAVTLYLKARCTTRTQACNHQAIHRIEQSR